jgi:hypothetical protein
MYRFLAIAFTSDDIPAFATLAGIELAIGR